MKRRNKRGPKMEPCGTPHETGLKEDLLLLTVVNCHMLLSFS